MGGQAAINLLSEFSDSPQYIRATATKEIHEEIISLIRRLRFDSIIQGPVNPNFGSTRLFAIKQNWEDVYISPIETYEVIDTAFAAKKDFGDIDLGITFQKGKTFEDVINNLRAAKDKYVCKLIGEELTIAVRLESDSTKVIQVDLLDISQNEWWHQVNQFASIKDMSLGIKGVVRDLLIRSIVATHPIEQLWTALLRDVVEDTDTYKAFMSKYEKKGVVDFNLRYSLAKEGLSFKITWLVDGVKKSYSKGGVKFDYLHDFSTNGIVSPLGWHRIKDIATWLGFDHEDDINHVTKMVEIVSKFDEDRKLQIWQRYQELLKTKLPTETRPVAQISVAEAEVASEYIKQHIGIKV
jgi:hypothetical protein